ncbi:uncharacterized protein LOC108103806 [Drosophila eugracilis]|uniref:uncharacterized protein LOC108103806 n=1 Tax=Drosophila eugracilis TaxID=29029 RepID=UPI0007E7D7EE|nr:uncharacterized protein LOC108103806 [Drosophila eugracilis]
MVCVGLLQCYVRRHRDQRRVNIIGAPPPVVQSPSPAGPRQNPLTSKLLDRGHTNHKSRHTETRLCAVLMDTGGVCLKYTHTQRHTQPSNTQTMSIHLEFWKSWSWSPAVLESWSPGVLESWSPTGRQSVVLGKQTNNENSTKGRENEGYEKRGAM